MHFQSFSPLGAVVLLLAAGAAASPVVTAPPSLATAVAVAAKKNATSTTSTSALLSSSCIISRTVTATFSQFTNGATLPDGYAEIDWSGWTITSIPSEHNITSDGHSTGNAITPPNSISSSFSWYQNETFTGTLKSFRFGCIGQVGGLEGQVEGFQPTSCSYTVTSDPGGYGYYVATGYGPFTYTADTLAAYLNGTAQPMKKVELPSRTLGPYSGDVQWTFGFFNGLEGAQVVFDDFVFEWFDELCYD